ncbi:MAG TPA: hypothetical protein VJ577_16675 [Burkholderiaceae bacterium]|nr:hypothetical protein [Burkholderiaceae bacterium]
MDTPKQFRPPLRPLYSLEAAATIAGITPALLESAIENGDIPGIDRVLRLGPRRLRHVYSRPLIAWLEGGPPAAPCPDPQVVEAAVADNFDPIEYADPLFQ